MDSDDDRPSRDNIRRGERGDSDFRNRRSFNNYGRDNFNRRDNFDRNNSDDFDKPKNRSFDNEPPFKRSRPYDGRLNNSSGYNNYGNDRNNRDRFNNNRGNFQNDQSWQHKSPNQSFNSNGNSNRPELKTLKEFVLTQDDFLSDDEILEKFKNYKADFIKNYLLDYFEKNKELPWFIEKYHPDHMQRKKEECENNLMLRNEVFLQCYAKGLMDNISVHISDSDKIRKLMDSVVIFLEGGNDNDLKAIDSNNYIKDEISSPKPSHSGYGSNSEKSESDNEESQKGIRFKEEIQEPVRSIDDFEESNDQEPNIISNAPRPLHETNSIFLRNIPLNLTRIELESYLKSYTGFLRLALHDPNPSMNFIRRGWATYRNNSMQMSDICAELEIKCRGLKCSVNRDFVDRVRINKLASAQPELIKHDLSLIIELIERFDKIRTLWRGEQPNPVLQSAREILENLKLREDENTTDDKPKIDLEEYIITSLTPGLDRLIFYLRFVHSIDFYGSAAYIDEDTLPHKCGIIYVRGDNNQDDFNRRNQIFSEKSRSLIKQFEEVVPEEQIQKIGLKDPEEEKEKFILANTVKINDEKWNCPLSGKRFKGPEFVRKHIFNKHMSKLELERDNALIFNNFVMDPNRTLSPVSTKRSNSNPSFNDNQSGNNSVNNKSFNRSYNSNNNNNNDSYRKLSSPDKNDSYNYKSYRPKNNFNNRNFSNRSMNRGGRDLVPYEDLDAPNMD